VYLSSSFFKAYFEPVSVRPNLVFLPNAQAVRVILSENAHNGEGVLATGVEFVCQSQKFEVKARKEVILAAGIYKPNLPLAQAKSVCFSRVLPDAPIVGIVRCVGEARTHIRNWPT
jgi:hypothetical protein